MTALVTGAPGFLGSHIVKELVANGVRVRGLALPDEALDNLDGVDAEIVRGNVLVPDDVRSAIEGVDTVFHAAAVYRAWAPDPRSMYEVNLRGTFNVLEGARRAGVRKVIYTASIAALGRPSEGALGTEDTPYEAWDLDFAYSRSKYLSMLLAKDFAAWGLDVTIICPGIILGPGDITPTPSGKMIIALLKGRAPGYTQGGASYIDVRDVARAHVTAAERGKPGEAYIVTAHNLSNRDFLQSVARASGQRQRPFRIPTRIAKTFVRLLESRSVKRGRDPDLASVFFEYGLQSCFYDNRKAVEQLGVEFRPLEDTIRDAIAFYKQRGLL